MEDVNMTKKQRAAAAVEKLKQLYPEAICSLKHTKPYELLLATRLSAQCTDARVNIVTKTLFDRYRSMEDFAAADVDEVAEIIRPCGLFKTKAKDLVGICQKLLLDYNGVVPDTIEELIKLPGVGRKTANLIVGDVYHKPAVVTDTHLIRISNRLGLVDVKEPRKVEDQLRKILPPEESNDFCHRMVHFGRDTCRARGPRCGECALADICKSAGKL
jgi:endonuclease III